MNIVATFTIVDESLFSVQFNNEDTNEFRKLFRNWNDPEYLHRFFSKNVKDLQAPFWGGISVDAAIEKTRKDAKKMEKKLLSLAKSGLSLGENLSDYFMPLTNNVIGELEKDKAKGLAKNSWLRIYAIRVDKNLFVICGGGIKLTKTMNEREHLQKELEKLEITRLYLLNEEDDELDFMTSY